MKGLGVAVGNGNVTEPFRREAKGKKRGGVFFLRWKSV
jgi:hypothetical protein